MPCDASRSQRPRQDRLTEDGARSRHPAAGTEEDLRGVEAPQVTVLPQQEAVLQLAPDDALGGESDRRGEDAIERTASRSARPDARGHRACWARSWPGSRASGANRAPLPASPDRARARSRRAPPCGVRARGGAAPWSGRRDRRPAARRRRARTPPRRRRRRRCRQLRESRRRPPSRRSAASPPCPGATPRSAAGERGVAARPRRDRERGPDRAPPTVAERRRSRGLAVEESCEQQRPLHQREALHRFVGRVERLRHWT